MTHKPGNIEIAQAAKLRRITDVARDRLGIPEEALESFGKYKAKISLDYLAQPNGKPDGKLVLVTAISPTAAGGGKTRTPAGPRAASNARTPAPGGFGHPVTLLGQKALIPPPQPAQPPCPP